MLEVSPWSAPWRLISNVVISKNAETFHWKRFRSFSIENNDVYWRNYNARHLWKRSVRQGKSLCLSVHERLMFRFAIISWMNINSLSRPCVKCVSNRCGASTIKDISVDVSVVDFSSIDGHFCRSCLDCQQVYHRECASNSEKCSKDRVKGRKTTHPRHPSSKCLVDDSSLDCSLFLFVALRIYFSG